MIPPPVRELLAHLVRAGHQAYLVGGCVRDIVRGLDPQDWDVTTSATPDEVLRMFPRVIPTGLRYGTVTVMLSGLAVEVTTFRSEAGYGDYRHPDHVSFVGDLPTDLARRDFTVNAMAMDAAGRLHDPFGGRRDLRRRLIRAVGDPRQRFTEDGLRLLRAVRLAAELGFELEAATRRALREQAGLLEHVAAERIGPELLRTLLAGHAGTGLRLMFETGLLGRIIPEIAAGASEPPSWEHLVATVERCPPDRELRLAALLHHNAGETEAILRRLRLGRPVVERVGRLVRHHREVRLEPPMQEVELRRLAARVGRDCLGPLCLLRAADLAASGAAVKAALAGSLERVGRVLAADPALTVEELAVDGHDVQRVTGLRPGRAVGRILARLLDAVLAEPSLNRRDRLEELARRLAAEPKDD